MPKAGITGYDQAAFLRHSFSKLNPASAGITPIILLIIWQAFIIPLQENYYEVVLWSCTKNQGSHDHGTPTQVNWKGAPSRQFSSPVLLAGSKKIPPKTTQYRDCVAIKSYAERFLATEKILLFVLFLAFLLFLFFLVLILILIFGHFFLHFFESNFVRFPEADQVTSRRLGEIRPVLDI